MADKYARQARIYRYFNHEIEKSRHEMNPAIAPPSCRVDIAFKDTRIARYLREMANARKPARLDAFALPRNGQQY